jgi:hypothetical protein
MNIAIRILRRLAIEALNIILKFKRHKNELPVPLKDIRPVLDKDEINKEISEYIESGVPFLVSRLGTSELGSMIRFKSLQEMSKLEFLRERLYKTYPLYSVKSFEALYFNAGFFPVNLDTLQKYYTLMLSAFREIDILGSWVAGENLFSDYFTNPKICLLYDLESYHCRNPWSKSLEGKNVLVVHPFADSIKKQYEEHRDQLFEDKSVLPQFRLMTVKAVQSIAGNATNFDSWFTALDYMLNEIRKLSFDVAIIGCGAYGLPLSASIKRMGKQAIHLGGATQILFGIRGTRWDGMESYRRLYNEHWIRPNELEVPKNANKIEGGCYW